MAELSWYEWEELQATVNKAKLANKSPHAVVTVTIDVEKLEKLLRLTKESVK